MIAPRHALPTRTVLAVIGLASLSGCASPGAEATAMSRSEIVSGTPVAASYFVKINQAMSNGVRLVCSGAFVTPHVVLTAAHCTRNYDYGDPITPTTATQLRYGEGFDSSQNIAGDENVGWKELGSTDIGLYRVAQPVALAFPRVFRSCNTRDLVGTSVVVSGRMAGDNRDGGAGQFFSSPKVTVTRVQNGVGANGNYLVLGAAAAHGGDSGGPWVLDNSVVGVTHTGNTGARFCDVAEEVRQQVEAWGDSLDFVEDGDGTGGTGGRGGGGAGGGGGTAGAGGTAGVSGASGAGSANGGRSGSFAGGSGGASAATAGTAGFAGSGAEAGSTGNAMAGSVSGGTTGAGSANGTSDTTGSSCTTAARAGDASGAWFSLACWTALVSWRRRRNAGRQHSRRYLTTIAGLPRVPHKQERGKVVGRPLAGGWRFAVPSRGFVTSKNITPDPEAGIGKWTREQFIETFQSRAQPEAAFPAKSVEMQTVMPWTMYRGMRAEDLGAIYDYLRTVPPVKNAIPPFEKP